MRSRISRAARSVNVMATSWLSRERRSRPSRSPSGSNSARNRSVSTNVLPQPAPADSATDTPRAVTARCCWSVRPDEIHSVAVGCHVFSRERT